MDVVQFASGREVKRLDCLLKAMHEYQTGVQQGKNNQDKEAEKSAIAAVDNTLRILSITAEDDARLAREQAHTLLYDIGERVVLIQKDVKEIKDRLPQQDE